jgi:hypothetical protein
MVPRIDIERLIRDIVRLRKAELTGAPDCVADVREDLEAMVGPTIGRAASARVLGITQTALDRHISRGAIPAVTTPAGRKEVPLSELVRLALDLAEMERAGDTPRPLAATLRSRKERAQGLDRATVLPPEIGSGRDGGGELRGLAFHRAVAARLDRQMVADAGRRLRRWRERGNIDERWAREWDDLLSRPLADIGRAITADDERGRDLRQNSPFAGALDHEERRRVMELVAAAT